MSAALQRLFRPRSVAVVGASADPAKMTGRPVGYLQRHGFSGAIYPINPRVTEIAGLRCWPNAAALPEAPDVALVLVGPERVESAILDLARQGTGAAIVLAGGFGEAGAEGKARQEALSKAAGAMRLLGPNTIGLVNRTAGIMLSASGALEVEALPAGGVSVVSQSGGILGSLLSRAADRGIGVATLVATGNEADLDSTDMVEHLLDDPATRVIALYMEGLRRPAAFRAAAWRAAAKGVPLVVFKVGRSDAGARSAMSHTGAMAGSDRAYDALFRQCGVIRAEAFSDLLDIPGALACGRRLRGRRVAVLTSTGGAGTLVADTCGMAGFALHEPDAATKDAISALVGGVEIGNPVDVTLAGVKPAVMRATMAALLAGNGYDALVTVVGSSALAEPDIVVDALVAAANETERPVLAYVSPHAPGIVRMLNGRGVSALVTPEAVAAVLGALLRPPAMVAPLSEQVPLTRLDGVGSGTLDEAESKALFARFGVPVAREVAVKDAAEAAVAASTFSGPVVVKVLSRTIAHKSDVGGVRVGVAPGEVARVCEEMRAGLARLGVPAPEGFIVQEIVRGGLEMIVGVHRDVQLGLLLLVGMGGVAAELLGDTAVRLLPVERLEAEEMVAGLRLMPLLTGYRGSPAFDVPALIDAIMAFSRMAIALGERLLDAEINPLFVLPAGSGVVAADGLVVLRDG